MIFLALGCRAGAHPVIVLYIAVVVLPLDLGLVRLAALVQQVAVRLQELRHVSLHCAQTGSPSLVLAYRQSYIAGWCALGNVARVYVRD